MLLAKITQSSLLKNKYEKSRFCTRSKYRPFSKNHHITLSLAPASAGSSRFYHDSSSSSSSSCCSCSSSWDNFLKGVQPYSKGFNQRGSTILEGVQPYWRGSTILLGVQPKGFNQRGSTKFEGFNQRGSTNGGSTEILEGVQPIEGFNWNWGVQPKI